MCQMSKISHFVKIATENMVHLHTYKKSLNLKFILRHNLFMFSPDLDYNMHMCNKDLKALHFLCSMDFMRRNL
jgi:uncharacterized metal-binding protein